MVLHKVSGELLSRVKGKHGQTLVKSGKDKVYFLLAQWGERDFSGELNIHQVEVETYSQGAE